MIELRNIFARSDGSQWHYLSGLVVGLAGNVAVGALSPQPRPANAVNLLVSGLFFLCSSISFSWLGWKLQRSDGIVRSRPNSSSAFLLATTHRLVDAMKKRLLGILLLGILFSAGGIVFLLFPNLERSSVPSARLPMHQLDAGCWCQ